MAILEEIGINFIASALWSFQKFAMWCLARILFWNSRNMEGGWQTVFAKDGRLHEEIVDVAQVGHYLRGRISYPEKKRRYKFSASIRETILVGRYEIAGRSSVLDRGSFTLAGNRVGELSELEGCYAWTDDKSQRPKADCYLWIKDGSTKLLDRVTAGKSTFLDSESGVIASRDFMSEEILGYFEGSSVEAGTRYSLTFEHRQIEPERHLRHLNHSCKPNAYFRERWLIADREIHKGDEITIDYQVTESMITDGFDCKCGNNNCRHRIESKLSANNPVSGKSVDF